MDSGEFIRTYKMSASKAKFNQTLRGSVAPAAVVTPLTRCPLQVRRSNDVLVSICVVVQPKKRKT